MLKFHTAGESHGMYLVGILEGIPAGLKLNLDYINSMVLLRKRGYGRGKRMNFEEDKPEFFGGLTRDNITTGAPIGFRVRNIDWEKGGRGKFSSIPRPGHSDFSGSIKYDFENLYLPAERASGRLTVLDVIAGSICILFLKEFEVETYFFVTSVGGVSIPIEHSDGVDAIFKKAISSSVLVPFPEFEEKIMGEINHAIKEKVSIMLDHFFKNTRWQIGGKAKAMIVTRSRLHAVRYKLEVDRQLKERKVEGKQRVIKEHRWDTMKQY